MSYDLYPLKTIERRKRYYAPALPEKWVCCTVPWIHFRSSPVFRSSANSISFIPNFKTSSVTFTY
jgi:hypothetical protein